MNPLAFEPRRAIGVCSDPQAPVCIRGNGVEGVAGDPVVDRVHTETPVVEMAQPVVLRKPQLAVGRDMHVAHAFAADRRIVAIGGARGLR